MQMRVLPQAIVRLALKTDGLIAEADYELTITGPGGAAVDAVTIDNNGVISIDTDIDKSNTGGIQRNSHRYK